MQKLQPDNVEEVEEQFKLMEERNEILNIQNLTKIYDTGKKAVDDLSLKVYNN